MFAVHLDGLHGSSNRQSSPQPATRSIGLRIMLLTPSHLVKVWIKAVDKQESMFAMDIGGIELCIGRWT